MGFRRGGRVLDKAKAMRSRGQHDKAIRYLEDAMERERRRRNPEPLMMAAYQNEKACILYRAGSTERAAEEIQECLDLIDKGGIDNDEFHAKVLRNQGVFLRELGRFKEARRSLRTARWIDDRRGPEGAYDSANDHYQLGLVLSGLNRHGEALAVFEETLTMYSDLSRGPTKEMGLTLNNIALQLYSLEDLEGAIRNGMEAYQVLSGLMPHSDPDLTNQMFNLARFLWKDGQLDEAERLTREVIDIEVQRGEERSGPHAHSLVLMAQIEYARQEYDKSVKLMSRALEINRGLHGRHSRPVIDNLHMLRKIEYQGKGDLRQAERIQKRILASEQRVSGWNSEAAQEEALLLREISEGLSPVKTRAAEDKKRKEIDNVFNQAKFWISEFDTSERERQERIVEKVRTGTAFLIEHKEFVRAERIAREVVRMDRTLLGDTHEQTMKDLKTYMEALKQQDKEFRGKDLISQLVTSYLDDETVDTSNMIELLALQGVAYRKSGMIEEAQASLEEAVSVARRKGDDGMLAKSLSDLSRVHTSYGQFVAAENLLREALAMLSSGIWHGSYIHFDVLKTYSELLEEQDRFEDAADVTRYALSLIFRTEYSLTNTRHETVTRLLRELNNIYQLPGVHEEVGAIRRLHLMRQSRVSPGEGPPAELEIEDLIISVGNLFAIENMVFCTYEQRVGASRERLNPLRAYFWWNLSRIDLHMFGADSITSETLVRNAIPIIREIRGSEDVYYARMLMHLGEVLAARNELEGAEEITNKAVKLLVHEHEDPTIHAVRAMLVRASVMGARGHRDDMEEIMGKAMSSSEALSGQFPQALPQVLHHLCEMAMMCEDYERAQDLMGQVWRENAIIYKEGHPILMRDMVTMARIQMELGDLEAAERYVGKALRYHEENVKRRHVIEADALVLLGDVQMRKHDVNGAISSFGRAYKVSKCVRGGHNPITISIEDRLSRAMEQT